jgi:hypothetical protein
VIIASFLDSLEDPPPFVSPGQVVGHYGCLLARVSQAWRTPGQLSLVRERNRLLIIPPSDWGGKSVRFWSSSRTQMIDLVYAI